MNHVGSPESLKDGHISDPGPFGDISSKVWGSIEAFDSERAGELCARLEEADEQLIIDLDMQSPKPNSAN